METHKVLRAYARPKSDSLHPDAVKGNQALAVNRIVRRSRSDSPSLQAYESAGQHDTGAPGYVRWPHATSRRGSAEERAAYFVQLHATASKEALPDGKQATSLLELMTIRAYHSKTLRRFSLGTALGLRTKNGLLTNQPAIVVFVSRKVQDEWLLDAQKLPRMLYGPGGCWCDVDVVEFSHQYGLDTGAAQEQVYNELVEGLRGKDGDIGPGSQVASEETHGTFGAVVRSRRNHRRPGFLTNHHVAVDFDQPKQKMYHPLPPSLGPGMYLGSVERATSCTSDLTWYGIFAGQNPETCVRAGGAFVRFGDHFDVRKVTTRLKGIGDMGQAYAIDLAHPITSLVGKPVSKLGGSSGLTRGTIMGYAVEYTDEKGVCFFTDFLILGERGQAFDIEGDGGALILLQPQGSELPQPVGIIWGGTANRGRLKLRRGNGPENWTGGVDIGRLLDLLELDLITSREDLEAAAFSHPPRQRPCHERYAGRGAYEEEGSEEVEGGGTSSPGPLEEDELPDADAHKGEGDAKRPRLDL